MRLNGPMKPMMRGEKKHTAEGMDLGVGNNLDLRFGETEIPFN